MIKAVDWVMASLGFLSLMAISARFLSAEMNTFELLLWRSIIGLLLVSPLLLLPKHQHSINLSAIRWQFKRNLFHFIGQYGWFLGISLLPLAQVIALEFTVPLWTAVVAALLLNERFSRYKVAALVCGLAGVLVIVQPDSQGLNSAAFIVLAAAIAYAFAHIYTKKLTKNQSVVAILWWMSLLQLPMGAAFVGSDFRLPSSYESLWILALGIGSVAGHFCVTQAMRHADVSITVTLDFLRLPLIATCGMVLFGEPLSLAVLVGAALMVLGNLLNLYGNKRQLTRTQQVA